MQPNDLLCYLATGLKRNTPGVLSRTQRKRHVVFIQNLF